MRVGVAIVAICLGLTACGGRSMPIGGASDVQVVSSTTLPAPSQGDMYTQGQPYRVGAFDKLRIDVYGIADLSQRIVQVDGGGQLSFPLAGTIVVTGKTMREIAEDIRAALRSRYVRDPQVTVNLEEAVSQTVTVDGEVKQPGVYPVVGEMTLMRAVATARGLSELAKQEDVVVFRTVNNQKMAALYNLKAIRRGAYPDPAVYPKDVVVVGDSPSRKLFRDLVSAATLITTPLIVLLR